MVLICVGLCHNLTTECHYSFEERNDNKILLKFKQVVHVCENYRKIKFSNCESHRLRLCSITKYCNNCITYQTIQAHCLMLLLFSKGENSKYWLGQKLNNVTKLAYIVY